MSLTAQQWDEIQNAIGTGSVREVALRLQISPGIVKSVWQGNRRRPGWIYERARERGMAREGLGNRCGLGTVARVDLFRAQGEVCYLCEQPLEFEEAFTDHDHTHAACSGKGCALCVRGLTHPSCNTAIGTFGDEPAKLYRIAENLTRATEKIRASWDESVK